MLKFISLIVILINVLFGTMPNNSKLFKSNPIVNSNDYVMCNIDYENSKFIISSDKYNFKINNLDLYAVYDEEQLRFIAGDVVGCNKSDLIICFSITEVCGEKICNIQYYDKKYDEIYNLNSYLDEKTYNDILKECKKISNDDEEIMGRIMHSQQQYKAFKDLKRTKVKRSNGAYLDMVIQPGTYDSYTNNDGIILDYWEDYFDEEQVGMAIYENRITDIVPRELFTQMGSFLYIGKEYGFYINSGYDYVVPLDFCSDVLVFDIGHAPYMGNRGSIAGNTLQDNGYFYVKPLFQARYATRFKENNSSFDFYYITDEDNIVVQHPYYESSNYYLSDIEISLLLQNANQLNTNDNNYSLMNDTGVYLTHYGVYFKTIKFNSNPSMTSNWIAENAKLTLEYAFGYIPVVGDLLGAIDYISNFKQNIDTIYSNSNGDLDPDENYNFTFETSASNQREIFGNYVRAMSASTKFSEEENQDDPVLFSNRLDSQFQLTYQIANIATYGNPYRVYGDVSLSVYGPDFCPTTTLNNPRIRNNASSSHLYDEFTYDSENIVSNIMKNITIISNGFEMYEFECEETYEYVFETQGSCDTKLFLYDSNLNLLSSDDDSGTNYNSMIRYNLENGKIYYIKTNLYSSTATGNFTMSVAKYYETVTANVNKTFYLDFGEEQIYKFIPITTKSYNFTATCGGDADPEMYIYNSNFTQIAYNDDSDNDIYPIIDITLTANQVYYVKINMIHEDYCGNVTLRIT